MRSSLNFLYSSSPRSSWSSIPASVGSAPPPCASRSTPLSRRASPPPSASLSWPSPHLRAYYYTNFRAFVKSFVSAVQHFSVLYKSPSVLPLSALAALPGSAGPRLRRAPFPIGGRPLGGWERPGGMIIQSFVHFDNKAAPAAWPGRSARRFAAQDIERSSLRRSSRPGARARAPGRSKGPPSEG